MRARALMCLWRRGSQAYCVCKPARGGWETVDVSDSLHLEWPSRNRPSVRTLMPNVSGQARLVWAYNIPAEARFRPEGRGEGGPGGGQGSSLCVGLLPHSSA